MKKFVLLILLFATIGCSENKETNNISKENLPEWLVVMINYYETRPISVQIYKGEWNKLIVYFIVDPSSACLCDFYAEDGKRIENNLLPDLRATSKNWILIYTYGNTVLTLDQIFSNFSN